MQLETEQPMRRKEHSIVFEVRAAQTDPAAADALIGQYMPFIRSETCKFTHAPIEAGHEDELSIATLAFYEAALSYQRGRGAFLPYAAAAIRNRLIDHYRVEQRHGGTVSLDVPAGEDGRLLSETLPDTRDEIAAYDLREATRAEIAEFGRQPGPRSRNLADSWLRSALAFPMWQITAPGRSAPWPPAGRCWTAPGPTPSCWTSCCAPGGCPYGTWSLAPAWTKRPSSATGNTWWLSCWRLPTDMRSSGDTCAS